MQVDSNGGIWTMILGAGPVVQLVLLTLVGFSVLCWTVILAKIRRFRRAVLGNRNFEEMFRTSQNLGAVYSHARRMREAPMASVFLAGHEEMRRLQQGARSSDAAVASRVWLEVLDRSLKKGIQDELDRMERFLPFLATTGNAAPFIGLFGTVWGIMRSFHNIGLTGSASLATVAPGISEALVATAAGLAAAIPAVIAFNGFMSELARFDARLQGFASDFLNVVERQMIQGKAVAGQASGEEQL